MKRYGGVEIKLHIVDGSEWSASRFGHFTA
jgi:hypothetical protein